MRITYSREKSKLTNICFTVGAIVAIFTFLMGGGSRESFVAKMIPVSVILVCGCLLYVNTFKCVRERRRLETGGTLCKGTVVEVKHFNSLGSGKNNEEMSFIVKYHSKILDKDIIFETPTTDMRIQGKIKDVKCLVVEAERNLSFEKKFGAIPLEIVGEENCDYPKINNSNITALMSSLLQKVK